ncbi:hypothetical protein BASA83_003918 [Batrachochytrium salamandrivorans]|nr:hypothetical protein BASA83_003918 [Batrachochytrium salamandrivorans]
MSKRLRWMTLTLRCRETTSADFTWRLRLGREPHDSEDAAHFLLYPHQPAKLNLSNSFNLDPTFSDPSILVSALSFPSKTSYFPGTLRLGPLSHVDTFFVDCGADDLFMDSKLAAESANPYFLNSLPRSRYV